MGFTQRRLVLGIACAALVAACNNGNSNLTNRGTINAGSRFLLVVDQQDPARLLIDSATGDLWQLQPDPSGSWKWARLANGPADAKALTPQEALGVKSKETPTS